MRPMLATKGTHVPQGSEWLHEVKWDGMRVLVDVHPDGELHIRSRNEKDANVSFPELHGLADLRRDLVLDGEVVAFLDGIPTFGALADRMHVGNARRAALLAESNPVTLLVFDLLRLDGEDLTGRPLSERRALLEGLGLLDVHWQVPATYDDGDMLLEATAAQRLEGIVSKKRSSLYLPGRRSPDWLKSRTAPSARTSSAAGATRRTAPRGSGRCWWGSPRGTGWSTAAGSAPASPARRASACSAGSSRWSRTRARSPTRCPRWTPPAPCGCVRSSSWTSRRSASPRRSGCASRRTAGSART